jgi:restriction endonuclease
MTAINDTFKSLSNMNPILTVNYFNYAGATFTMLIPLTDYKALEELSLENVEIDQEEIDEEINLAMIELEQNYDEEDIEKREKLASNRLSPAEIFAEKAATARAVAANSRAEEEARVLDAVIAADTLADAQARMERTDAARKAAANAR